MAGFFVSPRLYDFIFYCSGKNHDDRPLGLPNSYSTSALTHVFTPLDPGTETDAGPSKDREHAKANKKKAKGPNPFICHVLVWRPVLMRILNAVFRGRKLSFDTDEVKRLVVSSGVLTVCSSSAFKNEAYSLFDGADKAFPFLAGLTIQHLSGFQPMILSAMALESKVTEALLKKLGEASYNFFFRAALAGFAGFSHHFAPQLLYEPWSGFMDAVAGKRRVSAWDTSAPAGGLLDVLNPRLLLAQYFVGFTYLCKLHTFLQFILLPIFKRKLPKLMPVLRRIAFAAGWVTFLLCNEVLSCLVFL
jgi:hypothetical protein